MLSCLDSHSCSSSSLRDPPVSMKLSEILCISGQMSWESAKNELADYGGVEGSPYLHKPCCVSCSDG